MTETKRITIDWLFLKPIETPFRAPQCGQRREVSDILVLHSLQVTRAIAVISCWLK